MPPSLVWASSPVNFLHQFTYYHPVESCRDRCLNMRITCIFQCKVSITSSTLIFRQGLINRYAWHDVFLVHFFEWLTSSDLVEQHTNSSCRFQFKTTVNDDFIVILLWEGNLHILHILHNLNAKLFWGGGKASSNFFGQTIGSLPF
jgi:hypothetical protein